MLLEDADLASDSVMASKGSVKMRRPPRSLKDDAPAMPTTPPGTIMSSRSMDRRPACGLKDDNVVALLDNAALLHPRWWGMNGVGEAPDPCVFLG